jgi:hypothetical protein
MIFEAILYLSPQTFYTDTEAAEMLAEERGEFQAHLNTWSFIRRCQYNIVSNHYNSKMKINISFKHSI